MISQIKNIYEEKKIIAYIDFEMTAFDENFVNEEIINKLKSENILEEHSKYIKNRQFPFAFSISIKKREQECLFYCVDFPKFTEIYEIFDICRKQIKQSILEKIRILSKKDNIEFDDVVFVGWNIEDGDIKVFEFLDVNSEIKDLSTKFKEVGKIGLKNIMAKLDNYKDKIFFTKIKKLIEKHDLAFGEIMKSKEEWKSGKRDGRICNYIGRELIRNKFENLFKNVKFYKFDEETSCDSYKFNKTELIEELEAYSKNDVDVLFYIGNNIQKVKKKLGIKQYCDPKQLKI